MNRRDAVKIFGGSIIAYTLAPETAQAHTTRHHPHWHPPILPFVPPRPSITQPVVVSAIDVSVKINDRHATTTMTLSLHNPERQQQESVVIIPVSHQASIRQFGLEGAHGKFPAKLIPRDEARKIYDDIVRRSLDPALLEFAGSGLVKSSVFPVPAGGQARVRLVYEEMLETDNGRSDYQLLRSESPGHTVPWNVRIDWSLSQPIAAIYSPSHDFKQKRINHKRIQLQSHQTMQPGPVRVSATRQEPDHASASLVSYPDAPNKHRSGFFLMLLTPPAAKIKKVVNREVTLVIDKSGSMAGEKMDQALNSARQVIEGLHDNESFNIIVYNEAVEMFSPRPLVRSRENLLAARRYLSSVRVSGGTNIHDALQTAISQKPTPDTLPLILFLTDGIPTIGETREKKIRNAIAANNRHHRRIFTIGVGVDVNTPLLSRLADDSRARATYVLPKESVELKVAQVFRRLSGPVLSEPILKASDNRVSDLLPASLPDMFAGDQLVVLGRYRQGKHPAKPIHFTLVGQDGSGKRQFKFKLSTRKASKANSHVPRLWATRKIAILTEALRDLGADQASQVDMNDPKVRELVDEIVRLSTEHGVLSEYTAFLARDGMVFNRHMHRRAIHEASNQLHHKAVQTRSGAASVNQDWNIGKAKSAQRLNFSNTYLNHQLKKAEINEVRQVADKAFYRHQNEWVDAGLAGKDLDQTPTRTIKVSSPEFQQIVTRLVAENRQSCLALGENIRVIIDDTSYLIQSGK